MPNYYTTKVREKGDHRELEQFIKAHFNISTRDDDKGNEFFDFNTLIPKPDCLKDTEASSRVWDGIDAYDEDPVTAAEKLDSDTLLKVQHGIKCREECGFTDWYKWSIHNWGTKWNSFWNERKPLGVRSKTLRFQIITAWDPPLPVLYKLIQQYPNLSFNFVGRDECEPKWSVLSPHTPEEYNKRVEAD